jgi:hypothetical protein
VFGLLPEFGTVAAESRLRSPLAVLAEIGTSAAGLSREPHSTQNFASGAFSDLQLAQRFASGLPHSAQNFWPEPPSVPHFVQRIRFPQQ